MLGFGFFKRAGATGHVFFVANGKRRNKGLAYSGIYGPGTSIAVVPTVEQILAFAIDALTKDKQHVTVSGNVKVALNPPIAVGSLDFTVDRETGTYQTRWENTLNALVIERVLTPVLAVVKQVNVTEAVSAQGDVESAIMTALGDGQSALAAKGIVIDSCSVPSITAEDEDLAEALGATEREALLTEADTATHDRQMKAVAHDRQVKTYESATVLTLERDRSKLVEQQGKNRLAEADVDAKALAARMEPLDKMDSRKVLAAAFYEMGKSGRVGAINVTPDLLASLSAAIGK